MSVLVDLICVVMPILLICYHFYVMLDTLNCEIVARIQKRHNALEMTRYPYRRFISGIKIIKPNPKLAK